MRQAQEKDADAGAWCMFFFLQFDAGDVLLLVLLHFTRHSKSHASGALLSVRLFLIDFVRPRLPLSHLKQDPYFLV